jgi:6-phosphogluconolactonase
MIRPLLPLLAAALAIPAAHAAPATDTTRFPFASYVYVMSNDITGNSVAALRRNFFGGLDNVGVVATGGLGVGVGTTAPPPDPLGSQNSLMRSADGQWLFAVNAGSDDITVLDIRRGRPSVVGVFPSGGSYPVSLAERDGLLYILNSAGRANITVFRIGHNGYLSPLTNEARDVGTDVPLKGNQPDVGSTATQLQVDRSGKWLALTIKNSAGHGSIETFAIGRDGSLADRPVVTPSADASPFGFTFDDEDHLLVSEASGAAVSSYEISRDGSLKALDSSVPNGQAASCWLAAQHRYAFTSNAGSSTISGYRVDGNGQLHLTRSNGIAARLKDGSAPTDIKIADDGASLFVLTPGTGDVLSFFILPDGSLLRLSETHVFAPFSGMQGLSVE